MSRSLLPGGKTVLLFRKRSPAPNLICHRPLRVPRVQLKDLFRASPARGSTYSPEKMHTFRFSVTGYTLHPDSPGSDL
jgi:hypothetical protein